MRTAAMYGEETSALCDARIACVAEQLQTMKSLNGRAAGWRSWYTRIIVVFAGGSIYGEDRRLAAAVRTLRKRHWKHERMPSQARELMR